MHCLQIFDYLNLIKGFPKVKFLSVESQSKKHSKVIHLGIYKNPALKIYVICILHRCYDFPKLILVKSDT